MTDPAAVSMAARAVGVAASSGGGCRPWRDKEIESCEDVV